MPNLPWQKISPNIFVTPFRDPFQNWKPDLNVCGERARLPIYKMV